MNLDTSSGNSAMDYPAHLATYRSFVRGGIWLTALSALILILMAIFLL
jgi:hypothetical protein